MIAKDDAFLRQFPKRRSVLFGHGIGTHSIPDDQDDMALGGGGRRGDKITGCAAHAQMIRVKIEIARLMGILIA